MAKVDEKGNWLDPRGNPLPVKFVPEIDKRRDQTVEAIHKEVAKLEAQMKKVKAISLDKIQAYLDWLEVKTGVKRTGKGNLTLTSFSGNLQVEISMDDVIEFDERLQAAKTLVCEYVDSLEDNSSAKELAALAREAFSLDKKSQINKSLILRLIKFTFKDPRWVRAVELIRESIQVSGTRQYLNMRRRILSESKSEQWERINLNFSAL